MKPSSLIFLLGIFSLTIFAGRPSFGQSAAAAGAPKILGTIIDFSKVDFAGQVEFRSDSVGPGSGGGGGNSCALMLRQNTAVLVERLDSYKVLKDREADYQNLLGKIKTAKFVLGENLYIGNEKKDAINYPSTNTVVLEKSFCEKMDTISDATVGTLLHEFLGLALIDDKKFQISGHFVRYFNASLNRTERFENFDFTKGMNGQNCPHIAGEFGVVGMFQRAEFKLEKRAEISPGFNPVLRPILMPFGWRESFGNQFYSVQLSSKDGIAKLARTKLATGFEGGRFFQRDVDDSLIIDGQEHGRRFPESAGYYEKYRAGCSQGKLFIEYGSAHNRSLGLDGRVERVSTYVLRIIVAPKSAKELSVTTQSEHFNKEGRLIFKSYERADLQAD